MIHSYPVQRIRLHIQIHKIRKILIILKNDSNDWNHSSKFTVLVVVAFSKKKKKKTKTKKDRQKQKQQGNQTHNLPLLIHGESKSITSCVSSALKIR